MNLKATYAVRPNPQLCISCNVKKRGLTLTYKKATMPASRIVLAEYFTTEDRTLLFLVREDFDQPEVREIPVTVQEIQQFVLKYFREENGDSRAFRDKLIALNEGYQEFFKGSKDLIAPLVSPPPSGKRGEAIAEPGDIIWLVPHSFLHYLPLHALKVEGQYLIERNPVCYTPSASVMKYCREKRRQERPQRTLILADSRADKPLLHARQQGVAIQQLLTPNAELYLGEQATKELLTRRLSEAKAEIGILHLACHGNFNVEQGLKAGIELAPAEDLTAKDLTTEDIFGLEMNADLVTLSACGSGVNENRPGDELIGLTRALIYAGTPSVVVSLWSVEEVSTSILMQTFYEHLQQDISKVKALQQAQLRVKNLEAQEVICLCQEAKTNFRGDEGVWGRNLLDEDIAKIRWIVGDYAGAAADYRALKQQLPPDSPKIKEINIKLAQCVMAARKPIDYRTKIYQDFYYWSPFILVGDWK